jgi:hypothetical protein
MCLFGTTLLLENSRAKRDDVSGDISLHNKEISELHRAHTVVLRSHIKELGRVPWEDKKPVDV